MRTQLFDSDDDEELSVLDEIRVMKEKKHGVDWWQHETLPEKRSKKKRKRKGRRGVV